MGQHGGPTGQLDGTMTTTMAVDKVNATLAVCRGRPFSSASQLNHDLFVFSRAIGQRKQQKVVKTHNCFN